MHLMRSWTTRTFIWSVLLIRSARVENATSKVGGRLGRQGAVGQARRGAHEAGADAAAARALQAARLLGRGPPAAARAARGERGRVLASYNTTHEADGDGSEPHHVPTILEEYYSIYKDNSWWQGQARGPRRARC